MARRTIDGELVEKSIAFMEASVKKGAPFFLYLSFTQTHMPTLPHPDFAGVTGNGDYADALAELDYRGGQILDAVERLGVARDTIVVWTSDNGPSAQYPHGTPGFWRGRVGQALEGSIRTPFLIRWPGKIKAKSVNNEIVHIVDLLPTLANVGGYEVPDDRVVDGVDQLDFFIGRQSQSSREGFPIYGTASQLYAYKWRNWKLHFVAYEEANWKTSPYIYLHPNHNFPGVYNLLVDPKEEHPLGPEFLWVGDVIGKRAMEFKSTLGPVAKR
jgi:arylsulfatase